MRTKAQRTQFFFILTDQGWEGVAVRNFSRLLFSFVFLWLLSCQPNTQRRPFLAASNNDYSQLAALIREATTRREPSQDLNDRAQVSSNDDDNSNNNQNWWDRCDWATSSNNRYTYEYALPSGSGKFNICQNPDSDEKFIIQFKNKPDHNINFVPTSHCSLGTLTRSDLLGPPKTLILSRMTGGEHAAYPFSMSKYHATSTYRINCLLYYRPDSFGNRVLGEPIKSIRF